MMSDPQQTKPSTCPTFDLIMAAFDRAGYEPSGCHRLATALADVLSGQPVVPDGLPFDDYARLRDWCRDPARKRPELAFTAGLLRDVAQAVWDGGLLNQVHAAGRASRDAEVAAVAAAEREACARLADDWTVRDVTQPGFTIKYGFDLPARIRARGTGEVQP